jgi:1-acyl-sn-glycerol-3-phosphate acyltransferase
MKRIYLITPFLIQACAWLPVRFILTVFARFKVTGTEHLKELSKQHPQGVIFAPNHISEMDPIIVPAALPFLSPLLPLFYASRDRSFYDKSGWRQLFYGGLLFKLGGAHPVLVGLKDYEKSMPAHIELLKLGRSVCLFPEGGIGSPEAFREAKGGIAFLAEKSGAPIIPVAIKGPYKASIIDILLFRRKVSVTFGAPITIGPIDGSDPHNYKIAAMGIMDRIAELLKS